MRFALLIASLTLIAYLPIIEAGYIWDDDQYLTANPLIRSYSNLRDIWTSTKTPQYYPMVFSSFVVEYSLWKYNPLGYHLVNLLLHIANSILLALVLRKLGFSLFWLIALIFAIHPLQVESVAWITERKNVLSLLFYLASLLNYLNFNSSQHKKFYYFSFLLFILALLSKSTACTLPVIILLITHYQNRSFKLDDIFYSIPFFATGLVLGLNTAWLEKTKVGALGKEFELNFLEKTLLASKTSLFYIQKTLIPYPLMFNYPRWKIDDARLINYWPILIWIGILVLLIYFWGKNLRLPLYLFLAYFASLFPALGFIAVYPFKYSYVADHFSYLAIPALLTGIVLLTDHLISNLKFKKILAISSCLLLMGLTWNQTKIYKNEESLWKDTIAKNPCSRLALNNLGGYYRLKNQTKLALPYFDKAIECNPKNQKAYVNRGSALLFMKQFEAAIQSFDTALTINIELPTALCHRGMAKYFLNKFEEAKEDLQKAIAIKPRFALAYGYRAMTNQKLGAPEELICKDFNTACKFGKCDFLKLPEAKSCAMTESKD